MGSPITHSLSPRLHGFWIKKYGLDASYLAREVKPDLLEDILKNLPEACAKRGENFRGTNLTIPLKEKALEIVDILEPSAKRIGAVNTIIVGDDGKLIGRNTDGIGFRDNLADHMDISRFKGGSALVLGAGGAAKAIVYALQEMGFSEILITNRTRIRASDLVRHAGAPCTSIAWDEKATHLETIDLLINTTSLGMTGQPALEMSLEGLKKDAVVTDIVYVPLKTDLLLTAEKKGHVAVDGLGMLLHQAKAGFEAWFGVKVDVDDALRAHVLEGLKK